MASGSTRKLIYIDMDAFTASVEQRDDASLRGHPVAGSAMVPDLGLPLVAQEAAA